MHHETRPSRRTGYTLVEVLITVTIMGLAAAVVVPNMLQGGTMGVQAGARMIVADMLFAQNEAMAHNSARRIVFSPATDSYHVQKYDADAGAWVLDYNPVLGGNDKNNYQIDFTQDSRFKGVDIVSAEFGGTDTIQFDDLGNPSSGGTVRVRYDQHIYDIKVAPFTGRVTIEKVDPNS